MHFTDYDTRLAAYAVIVDDRNRILLTWYNGQRRAGPCWTLPGGEVEYAESLPEAVVREVREETGYDVTLGPLLTTHTFTSADGPLPPRPYKSVRVVFTAAVTGGALGTLEIGGSTDRAEWLPVDAIPADAARADIVDVAVTAWRGRGR